MGRAGKPPASWLVVHNGVYKALWHMTKERIPNCNYMGLDEWISRAEAVGDVMEAAFCMMFYAADHEAFLVIHGGAPMGAGGI